MPAHSDTSSVDTRAAVPPHDVDTPRTFPHYASLAQWEQRRAQIRRQILVSCGLDPLPPRTPLKPSITGKMVRDGYTIERVSIQTYPGFYLCGNLYRPTGKTQGKRPGILVAHGHWANGRMANEEAGSIPARAITFAREGCVAFTYDMVGYNDTHQIPHTFANDRSHWVWGVSLMGLQTWNSIRALDFISSLPDVDRSRLAITGESGGGTQTMILGAIDDRLAAVGPCVMVSHSMQGGCLCENAPGLRVDFSNMEVAACAAPKPQIMVGATGDWTKTMMTIEGPGVESIYKLYSKPENLKYCIFDFGHNINKTSREAVYQAFGGWLLHLPDAASLKEPAYKMEPVEDLRVFPGDMPKDAIDADTLTARLKEFATRTVEDARPQDAAGLERFKKQFTPVWRQTLDLDEKPAVQTSDAHTETGGPGYTVTSMRIGRASGRDSIPVMLFTPSQGHAKATVILAAPDGMRSFLAGGAPGPSVEALLKHGCAVLLLDCFLTGASADAAVEKARNTAFGKYFDTYNRTDTQERVQDLVTAAAYAHSKLKGSVVLIGTGAAGLWALLAAPDADAVGADANHFDDTADAGFTTQENYVPCLRHMGDYRTVASLAAPHPIALFNVDDKFTAAPWIKSVYRAVAKEAEYHEYSGPVNDEAIIRLVDAAGRRGGD